MAVTGDERSMSSLDFAAEAAQQLRIDGIRASTKAGSGHPTSSMSAADLIAVLAARHLRYDFADPRNPNNDHLIFSKGHASPLLYALYKACGAVSDEELLTYRTFGSRLQGHPTPVIPWVDVATGSLGQGLPVGVGIAIAGRHLDKLPYRVYVLCGDSELAEGSIWEALDKASHYKLGNLVVMFDINRLGQRGPTEFEWDLDAYRRRVEAFGCRAVLIDGHDVAQIDEALREASEGGDQPTVIIARTVKGKGFSEIENQDGWHGKALPEDMAERAIAELGGVRNLRVDVAPPDPRPASEPDGRAAVVDLPAYERGAKVATRKAYGEAITALGARADVVALDGEVSNSTYAELFTEAHPERFFEMYIAEQQMVAAAVGIAARGYVVFASTFAAFLSRAYDFIRMAGVSGATIRLSGSHAGCEIGADGPSQMALEDLAAMRAVHGSTVLYPSDAVSTAKLVASMAERRGISYIRTTRGAYPVLYASGEEFEVGGSKVLRQSDRDAAVLVGAGVTLHACLGAADELAESGVNVRVIDCYSVKPIDTTTLRRACRDTGGRILVVEDHYPEGGIGEAVMQALALEDPPPRVVHLAVRDLPGSGTTAELMRAAGIDQAAIVSAAKKLAGALAEVR
ncbi:MAG: transketolase [Candidatus Dormibacteraeota bacterium]|nr:transketolase [Candidatus Dormibacteraeota bacterium]MBV9525457.1 transketolase [Candidatus Dormibacteraeota bacterium]